MLGQAQRGIDLAHGVGGEVQAKDQPAGYE
jgi:hypothetical protein